MSPAGVRKKEREVVLRTGIAHYIPHEDMGQTAEYRIQLDWLPISLKNRGRSFYNKALERIQHYPDAKVVRDKEAIRALWEKHVATLPRRPPISTLRMELSILFFRPMSKNEALTGIWNRRRGDLVSAHELIADALEGIAYEDDSQVTKLVIEERRDCMAPSVIIIAKPR